MNIRPRLHPCILLISGLAATACTAPQPAAGTAAPSINSFEECVAAGNMIAKSYPRQCHTQDGRRFFEDLGNRVAKLDLIQAGEPGPNQRISSPLLIRGKARGNWFFEGSFPVKLTDNAGKVLATGIAQAQGKWMTDEFVPFQSSLAFQVPAGVSRGTLLLIKDNASGLPQHDDQLTIPVKF